MLAASRREGAHEAKRALALSALERGAERKRQARKLLVGLSKHEQNEVVRHLFTSVSKMPGEAAGTAAETYGSYLWLRLVQLALSALVWKRAIARMCRLERMPSLHLLFLWSQCISRQWSVGVFNCLGLA